MVLVTNTKVVYQVRMICTGAKGRIVKESKSIIMSTTVEITWQGDHIGGICGDASVGQETVTTATIMRETITTTILWHGPKKVLLVVINGASPQLPIKRAINFLNGVFLHRC